uniref:Uncharacterized protein n=1 Tax=Aegilops tauschii subsp. strangulata TaxID=200361 RepID=A0A453BZU7_AEGTS
QIKQHGEKGKLPMHTRTSLSITTNQRSKRQLVPEKTNHEHAMSWHIIIII